MNKLNCIDLPEDLLPHLHGNCMRHNVDRSPAADTALDFSGEEEDEEAESSESVGNNEVEEPPGVAATSKQLACSQVQGQSSIRFHFGRASATTCSGSGSAGASSSSAAATSGTLHIEGSMLQQLPTLAAMERVRATKLKQELGPRGRQKAGRMTKETKVPLQKRVQQFPDETLKISNRKLFCECCREEMPNLKEGIKRHCESSKHAR